MMRNTNIARNLGYMDVGATQLLKPHEIGDMDPRDVMVIGTGSQGEPMAALNRISKGIHPALSTTELDSIIFSSRTIPGNEVRVHRMINELSRVGCHIYHQDNAPGIHASGHGSAAELTTLLQLVRPRTFMPVHGEWRHMRAHAELGLMAGVKQEDIIFGANGRVVEVANGRARLTDETVQVGARLVDRQTNEEILDEVMEDRQHLSGDGLVVVVARVRAGETYDGVGQVEVVTRGIIDEENSTLLEDARDAAESTLSEATGGTRADLDELEHMLEESISAALSDRSRRAPMVVPVVIEE
jgi:ribonuclease J